MQEFLSNMQVSRADLDLRTRRLAVRQGHHWSSSVSWTGSGSTFLIRPINIYIRHTSNIPSEMKHLDFAFRQHPDHVTIIPPFL